MKGLLLSLGLVTTISITTNFIANGKTSTNEISTNNKLENYMQYKIELAELMDLKISINNEAQIKQMILDSIYLLNNQVYVNRNLFTNLHDHTMKVFFNDKNFEKIIQDMYQNKILLMNKNQQFSFIESKVQTQSSSVWTESHWYWFGYWKLHFDHQSSQFMNNLLSVGSGVADIGYAISDLFPISAISVGAFSAFAFANSIIFESYDHGYGVWIGWYLLIPDMGWGSH